MRQPPRLGLNRTLNSKPQEGLGLSLDPDLSAHPWRGQSGSRTRLAPPLNGDSNRYFIVIFERNEKKELNCDIFLKKFYVIFAIFIN